MAGEQVVCVIRSNFNDVLAARRADSTCEVDRNRCRGIIRIYSAVASVCEKLSAIHLDWYATDATTTIGQVNLETGAARCRCLNFQRRVQLESLNARDVRKPFALGYACQ